MYKIKIKRLNPQWNYPASSGPTLPTLPQTGGQRKIWELDVMTQGNPTEDLVSDPIFLPLGLKSI